MAESLKPMVITDPDESREYVLEFNRKSVQKTEDAGFDMNKVESSPMKMLPLLFWGAFLMHQPYMTRQETDRILFDGLGGLNEEEVGALGKLYAAPYNDLIAEDKPANPRRMSVKF